MQSIGEQMFPYQYIEFLMMKTFGWTPREVMDLTERQYQMISSLMLSEGKAAKMKAIESSSRS